MSLVGEVPQPDCVIGTGACQGAPIRAACHLIHAAGVAGEGGGELAAVRVPITWLLGTETRIEWFRKLHARAVQVALSIRSDRIGGAGHVGYLDAPEEFIAAVLRAVANAL